MTIKIPDNYMGKPIKGSLEKVLASAPVKPSVSPAQPISNPNIQISNISGAWKISGVQYRNGLYEVDLANSLLDNGNAKTQDDWAAYSKVAMTQNSFRTPDYPLFYGIVKALYTARDDSNKSAEVEEAKQFIKSNSRARWLMTLTRIKYSNVNSDTLVHNYGLSQNEEWAVSENFVGGDGEIGSLNASKELTALLGDGDVNNVKEVFKWLNGTDIYLYRVNSKQDTERVARFDAYSGRAYLYCLRDPTGTDSSLGVRVGAVGTVASQK